MSYNPQTASKLERLQDILTCLFRVANFVALCGTRRLLTIGKDGSCYNIFTTLNSTVFDFGYLSSRQKHAGCVIAIPTRVLNMFRIVRIITPTCKQIRILGRIAGIHLKNSNVEIMLIVMYPPHILIPPIEMSMLRLLSFLGVSSNTVELVCSQLCLQMLMRNSDIPKQT